MTAANEGMVEGTDGQWSTMFTSCGNGMEWDQQQTGNAEDEAATEEEKYMPATNLLKWLSILSDDPDDPSNAVHSGAANGVINEKPTPEALLKEKTDAANQLQEQQMRRKIRDRVSQILSVYVDTSTHNPLETLERPCDAASE